MSTPKPQVIMIAGCNGAGKTSLAPFLLRGRSAEFPFINADTIASGLSAFEPESVSIEAGRVMLHRLHELVDKRESFAFESTLAARSYASWLKKLRKQGYEVHLVYVWLRNVDLALERVTERVRRGGHAIPEQDIRRRYIRGIVNLLELYIPIVDMWAVYDNSRINRPQLVATGRAGTITTILRPDRWKMMVQTRPK